ncbi:hypothetical protein A6R68_05226, partial [Neotoma lepida]
NCGFFFPEIKRNLGKYVHRCPESVRRWLRQLKAAGKITMLITSSHSDYCRLIGTYVLGLRGCFQAMDVYSKGAVVKDLRELSPGCSQGPEGAVTSGSYENDENSVILWVTLLDICALAHRYLPTSALIFSQNDEEQEELPALDKPGWYSQGNAAHLYELLKKMTGKPEPKVVYFGDSMHSDIFPAHHYSNWETVLILEELQGQEKEKAEDAEPLEKRGKYESSS